jgi:glutamate dehydrogenase/leucine dehydrogenase
MSNLKALITQYENKLPEIVFEWNDVESNAKGWVVINSLRGGAAGGGTRMRKGVTLHEVTSLAKTMEVKFTVSGPSIGGAKSGIDFDPSDPRKNEVLKRWFKVVSPLLKSYYGTGGDMNINEIQDVIPITESYGLWHPQEGIVEGHFKPSQSQKIAKIGQLRLGVPMVIANPDFSPDVNRKYTISDMITGYGVAESVIHYYKIWKGGNHQGKSVLIQGWGNVGAAAGFFLSKAGFKIKGIMDKGGHILSYEGFSNQEVTNLFLNRKGNALESDAKTQKNPEKFWNHGADVFLPCAGSRLVSKSNLNDLIKNGCELIASGANVPFNNSEILYGEVMEYADNNISVIPDFIANCGMARTFAYCMQNKNEISSVAIFNDVSKTIKNALQNVHSINEFSTQISEKALTMAIKKLI